MHFPVVYTLSTVNLIYHGTRDFRLNPHCTAFTGDSGSGKSLLADLLQLILVGPNEYHSATHAKGERLPHTLVRTTGSESSRGYAFVNVQLGPKAFLVLGCALESASRQCIPFVIQQGTDWQNRLRPIAHPIKADAFFAQDEAIVPLDYLEDHLRTNHQVVGKTFRQTSQYLRQLVNNDLVPLDITRPKQLQDFGSILRSFARSGELDQNPKSIPAFLFGQQDQERICKLFETINQRIEQDQHNYRNNVERIQKLTDKSNTFRKLGEIRYRSRASRRTYQAKLLADATQALHGAEKLVVDRESQTQKAEWISCQLTLERAQQHVQTLWAQALQHRANLRELASLPQLRQQSEQETNLTRDANERALKELATIQQRVIKAKAIDRWLPYGQHTYEGLLDYLTQTQIRIHQLTMSQQLWQHLEARGQAKTFRELEWHSGVNSSIITQRLDSLREDASAAQRLAAYSDPDNPESLLNWAVRRNLPLTLAQESVLAHFGRLEHWRAKEARDARFLAQADALINDRLQIETGSSPNGFWLCVSGIHEWVEWLPAENRLFSADVPVDITTVLEHRRQQTQREARQAAKIFQMAQAAYAALTEFPNWQDVVPWLGEDKNADSDRPADFPDSTADLQAAIGWHQQLTEILSQLSEAQKQSTQSQKAYETAIRTDEALQRRFDELIQATCGLDRHQLAIKLRAARHSVKEPLEAFTALQPTAPFPASELRLADGQLSPVPPSISALESECLKGTHNLEEQRKSLAQAREDVLIAQAAERAAASEWKALPALEPDEAVALTISEAISPEEVQELENEYKLDLAFAARRFLSPDEAEGMKALMSDYFLELLNAVLPKHLKRVVTLAEGLESLRRELHQINETSRDIAQRKYSELVDVVRQVRTAYERYDVQLTQLRLFFRREKVQITGGYRAWLTKQPSPHFPLSWLDAFEQQALLPASTRQTDDLKSPEALLLDTFRKQEGARQNAPLRDILNPVNYLQLNFEMRNDDGHVNDGSTGQTFMAAALLNMARLSVVGQSGGAQAARPVLRVIAIDEAEGLGSNYPNLLQVARDQKIQVIALAIRPLTYEEGFQQRLYLLNPGRKKTDRLNGTPLMLSNDEMREVSDDPFLDTAPELDFEQPQSDGHD